MDRWIAFALLMLIGWAAVTFTTEAPGWIHLFLTAGVSLLVWRIVTRSTPSDPSQPETNKK